MALRGVDHIDLAVSDVERSLAFYLGMLGPLGLDVEGRFQTYRETEEVVYLGFGQNFVPGAVPETRLGLRKADGGGTTTTTWGSSTWLLRSRASRKSTTPTSAV